MLNVSITPEELKVYTTSTSVHPNSIAVSSDGTNTTVSSNYMIGPDPKMLDFAYKTPDDVESEGHCQDSENEAFVKSIHKDANLEDYDEAYKLGFHMYHVTIATLNNLKIGPCLDPDNIMEIETLKFYDLLIQSLYPISMSLSSDVVSFRRLLSIASSFITHNMSMVMTKEELLGHHRSYYLQLSLDMRLAMFAKLRDEVEDVKFTSATTPTP